VFITQFPVLHDVKNLSFLHDIAKSIGRFLPGCPFQLVYEVLGVPRRAVFKREGTWILSSSLSLTLFQ